MTGGQTDAEVSREPVVAKAIIGSVACREVKAMIFGIRAFGRKVLP